MSHTMEIPNDASSVTIVSTFTLLDPADQQKLLHLLDSDADRWLREVPGFLGGVLHVSMDNTKVINYAQWKDLESVQGMLNHPEAKKHVADVAELATMEAVRATVASSYAPR